MATKIYKPKRKISATESEEIKIPASSVDGLSTVATSGSYNDLSNKPTIPDVSGLMPKSGGAFTGNISVPSTITFTDTTNPYIKMTTGGTAFYFQSTSGQFGLGPTWDKATHWDANGNVTFPTTPKVGSSPLALKSDIPSVPTNYVTTDTAQDITGEKSFYRTPKFKDSIQIGDSNRIYGASDSPVVDQFLPAKDGTFAMISDIPDVSGKANLDGGNTWNGGQDFLLPANSSFYVSDQYDGTIFSVSAEEGVALGSDVPSPILLNYDPGTTGQVLTSQGAGKTPQWTTPAIKSATLSGTTLTITL